MQAPFAPWSRSCGRPNGARTKIQRRMQPAQPFALSLRGRSEPRWSYELVAGGPAVYCLLAPPTSEVSQAVLPTKSAELRVRACVLRACCVRMACVLRAYSPPRGHSNPPPPLAVAIAQPFTKVGPLARTGPISGPSRYLSDRVASRRICNFDHVCSSRANNECRPTRRSPRRRAGAGVSRCGRVVTLLTYSIAQPGIPPPNSWSPARPRQQADKDGWCKLRVTATK